MQTKLSAAQRQEILADVPTVIRKLAHDRDALQAEVDMYRRREHATKVAHAMTAKGLHSGDVQELAASLEKDAADGTVDLDVVEQAVEMNVQDMGKHASVSDQNSGSSGGSDFERFLLA